MADTKISALTALTGANVDAAADYLAIVDTSVTTTKKILVNELLAGQATTTVFGNASTALTLGHVSGANTVKGATTFSQALTGSVSVTTPFIVLGTTPATLGDIRIPNNSSGIQARNAADTGNLQLVTLNSANVQQFGQSQGASVANDGTLNLGELQVGLLVVASNADRAATFVLSNSVVYEQTDPDGLFSVTQGTATSTNLYNSAGSVILENKTGGAKAYYISHLK